MQPRPSVIFDCDGTLTDSHHVIVESMIQAFTALGEPLPEDIDVRRVIGLSLPNAISKLAPSAAGDRIDRLVEAYKNAFVSIRQSGNLRETLYPGVVECLKGLKDHGAVLGIATGKSRRGLDYLLEMHDLRAFFETLQCADGNLSKPHPQMLEKAMFDLLAEPKDTVMVGDSPYDMQMARAAGAHGVGVAWSDHGPGALKRAGASAMLTSYRDWTPLLAHWEAV